MNITFLEMITSWYYIVRDFYIFDITQNTIHSIMYFYWGHSVSPSLGKGSRWRRQQKMTWKGRRLVKKVMPLTQILLCTFFCNSIFFTSWFLIKLWQYFNKKKNTSKKKPTSVPEVAYVTFAQKYYNSTTLFVWFVYKHMCV